MADFLQPKETQVQTIEQEPKNVEDEQRETIGRFPIESVSSRDERLVFEEESLEDAGRVVSLKDRLQEAPVTKSERLRDIEKELAEDLEDIYEKLDQDAQIKVREDGEKASQEIEKLIEEVIESGGDFDKKALKIVRDWMHEIPGVNRFFLEQESKRKIDKIRALMYSSEEESSQNESAASADRYQKAA